MRAIWAIDGVRASGCGLDWVVDRGGRSWVVQVVLRECGVV